MVLKKLSFLGLIALMGCSLSAHNVYLPDGSTGFRISCDGNEFANCLQTAGEVCGAKGYQTFDATGRPQSPHGQNQSAIAAFNHHSDKAMWNAEDTKNIFIKCAGDAHTE